MALKLFRFKHLKDHTAGNRRRDSDPFSVAIKDHVLNTKYGGSSDKICPVFLLPLLITVIFVFTIAQIVLIHRTIEAYKLRDQAYRDCYYPSENKNGTGVANSTVTSTNSTSTTGLNSSWASAGTPNNNNNNDATLNHKPLVLPKANYD